MAQMTSQAQARVDDLMKHWLDDPESDEVFTVEHITDADYPQVPEPCVSGTRGDLDALEQLRDRVETANWWAPAAQGVRVLTHGNAISELGELL